jgi:prepilin-type N-terminal cleavage/methylation domain-containing protein
MQGLYGYFARNLKGKKGQSGFTLIELLVVVTILGVLAAIVTLSLVGLTTSAQARSQQGRTVQAGLGSYMAYFNLDQVTGAGPTADMKAKPDGTDPLYNSAGTPTFLRNSPTNFAYTWDGFGRITSITAGPTSGAVPTGCKASGT